MSQNIARINETARLLDARRAALRSEIDAVAGLLGFDGIRDAAQLTRRCTLMGTLIREAGQIILNGERQLREESLRAEEEAGDIALGRSQLSPDWYALRHKIDALRHGLNRWPEVQPLIRSQIDAPAPPLFAPPVPPDAPAVAREAAVDRLFERLHKVLNPLSQDDTAQENGAHPDVPYPMGRFLALALAARRVCLAQRHAPPLRFLDIGCGGGLKLAAACQVFERADGVEFDPGYVRAARNLMGLVPGATGDIHETDATGFSGYDGYDVLYLFCPMRDPDRLIALERAVVAGARPGAVLIAPYRGFAARAADLGCGQLEGAIFVRGAGSGRLEDLRAGVGRIGTSVVRPAAARADLWEPILAVSHANGYALRERDWSDEV